MSSIFYFTTLSIVVLTILFAGHFFVYYSLVQFFQIVNSEINLVLAITIFLLIISFITSSILANWRKNFFTKFFYLFSGIWIAFLINLLLILFLVWIVVSLAGLFGYFIDYSFILVVAIVLATLYTVWGVRNAFNPHVKQIEVKIKNLPSIWNNKKVVHISDIHLGHIFDHKTLKKVVDKINVENPSAVFITGDLFDGMSGELNDHVAPLDDIKTKYGTFFVTGNHEVYFGVKEVRKILDKTKLRVMSDEIINLDGLKILGLEYSDHWESNDLANFIIEKFAINHNEPSVLLYHSPVQVEQIKKTGISLQLSGHTHRGQMLPFTFLTKIIFKGFDYGLHQDDNFSLYTTSGIGTWGPAVRTGSRSEIVVIKLIGV